MKIGILTFHNSRNYGAVMQAYALVQALEAIGYYAEVIDYKCDKIQEDLDSMLRKGNVIKKAFYLKKKVEFDSFNLKYLNLSTLGKKSVQEKFKEYDVLIAGSDQVWNKSITASDDVYFLKGVHQYKIAYAASCGDNVNLTEQDANTIKSFDSVSVREHTLQKKLKSLGVESVTVCDPTILAGNKAFEQFSMPRLCKQKYVFVFMIWKSKRLVENATRFAETKGLKVISNKGCLNFLFHSKPSDFVSWIANAEYVFTNSFHGTVFSLLFHKPFISSIVRPDNKSNTRVNELLTSVGCTNNIMTNEAQQVESIDMPDYESVDEMLGLMQLRGKKFLEDAFSKLH